MRVPRLVKPLIGVDLLMAVLFVGLLARTAFVTRRDLHIDRLAQQLRFPAATDAFLALTNAASEAVGLSVLLVALIALVVRGRRWDAARLAAAAGASWLLAIGVKDLIGRPRPPRSIWALTPDASGSFPSGHDTTACVMVLIALVSLRGAGRWRVAGVAVATLFAVVVGMSRVYLGDHYPTDVLGSWLVVAAASVSVWIVCDTAVVQKLGRAALRDPRRELLPASV